MNAAIAPSATDFMPTSPAVVDLMLGAGLLIVVALALFPRSRQRLSMAFLGLGTLMTLVWLRLGGVDVALAEAALGTGLLSGLLVWLATRTSDGRDPGAEQGGGSRPWFRVSLGVVAGAVISIAGLVVWARLEPSLLRWSGPLPDRMVDTGVTHEVTGVLLAFRAYDTLLESAVLMFAGVAVLALGRDGGLHQADLPPSEVPSTLRWLVRGIAPVLLLLVFWLLFVGSSDAGGAFQSGALLAGLLILLTIAQVSMGAFAKRWLRPLLVSGVAVFILAGLVGPMIGRAWLSWDATWASAAVVTVEVFLTAGIAAGLYLMYFALVNPQEGGGWLPS